MYCKIQPNTSCATGLVSYLSKEDGITKTQQERLTASERASEGVVDYLDKENTSLRGQINKINGLVLNDADKSRCVDFLKNEDRIQGAKFFNGQNNQINPEEVVKGISGNVKGLKIDETHFYMMTIAPSKGEIEHMEKVADQMQAQLPDMSKGELIRSLMEEYTKDAMESYARNFNREGITGEKDLVWYGKIEQDRYWKHNSTEVQTNKAIARKIKKIQKVGGREEEIKSLMGSYMRDKDGRVIYSNMPKDGANYHAHVIVSRKDKTQTKSLSPLSKYKDSPNHQINGKECKAGFNRTDFLRSIERNFDEKFKFDRPFRQSVECHFPTAKLKKLEIDTPKYVELKQQIIDANNSYNNRRGLSKVEPFMQHAEGWLTKMELDNIQKEVSLKQNEILRQQNEIVLRTEARGGQNKIVEDQKEVSRLVEQYRMKLNDLFKANDSYNEKHAIKERFGQFSEGKLLLKQMEDIDKNLKISSNVNEIFALQSQKNSVLGYFIVAEERYNQSRGIVEQFAWSGQGALASKTLDKITKDIQILQVVDQTDPKIESMRNEYQVVLNRSIRANETYNKTHNIQEPFWQSFEGRRLMRETVSIRKEITKLEKKGSVKPEDIAIKREQYNKALHEMSIKNEQYNTKNGVNKTFVPLSKEAGQEAVVIPERYERFIRTAKCRVLVGELKQYEIGTKEYNDIRDRIICGNELYNHKHGIKEAYGRTYEGREMILKIKEAKENSDIAEYRNSVLQFVKAKEAYNKRFDIREINVRRTLRQVMFKAKSIGRTGLYVGKTTLRGAVMMGVNYGVNAILPSYALKAINVVSSYNQKQQEKLLVRTGAVNVVHKQTGQVVARATAGSIAGVVLPGIGGLAVKGITAVGKMIIPGQEQER